MPWDGNWCRRAGANSTALPNGGTFWPAVQDARMEILFSVFPVKPSHDTSRARSCLQSLTSYIEVLDVKQ